MNKKLTDILAYVTIIGWLIAYFAGDRENSKFHLNQGLGFAVCELILWIVGIVIGALSIGLLGFIFAIIGWIFKIVGILVFVFAIVCLVMAAMDKEWKAPIFGDLKLLK